MASSSQAIYPAARKPALFATCSLSLPTPPHYCLLLATMVVLRCGFSTPRCSAACSSISSGQPYKNPRQFRASWRLPSFGVGRPAFLPGYLATNTAFAQVFAIQTCLGLPFVSNGQQPGSTIAENQQCTLRFPSPLSDLRFFVSSLSSAPEAPNPPFTSN